MSPADLADPSPAPAAETAPLDLALEEAAGWLSGAIHPGGLRGRLEALTAPSALLFLADRFGLDEAALESLVLVLAPDLSPDGAAALAAHPLASQGRASPALIEACGVADPARTLSPVAPLRAHRLVRLAPGEGFAHRTLSAEESVLHAVRGAPSVCAQLIDLLTPLAVEPDGS